jgi:hypothetical protein
MVGKLLEHNPDTRDELPEVFSNLDGGSAVDISGIDDNYV